MNTRAELTAILAQLDKIAEEEEHAGNSDAAELVASIAEKTEHVLGTVAIT